MQKKNTSKYHQVIAAVTPITFGSCPYLKIKEKTEVVCEGFPRPNASEGWRCFIEADQKTSKMCECQSHTEWFFRFPMVLRACDELSSNE